MLYHLHKKCFLHLLCITQNTLVINTFKCISTLCCINTQMETLCITMHRCTTQYCSIFNFVFVVILCNRICYLLGALDHLQQFDHQLWAHCMLNESTAPPKFYPADFHISANLILKHTFGLSVNGISHENCQSIYLRLVQLINELVSRGVPVCSEFAESSNSDTD